MPRVATLLSASLILATTSVDAQNNSSAESYALEALKVEANDMGEKMACLFTIHLNSKDVEFKKRFTSAYASDVAEFSGRVENHVSKFGSNKDADNKAIYRFHTWHNLRYFVDQKEREVSNLNDSLVNGRCNIVAATSIARHRDSRSR